MRVLIQAMTLPERRVRKYFRMDGVLRELQRRKVLMFPSSKPWFNNRVIVRPTITAADHSGVFLMDIQVASRQAYDVRSPPTVVVSETRTILPGGVRVYVYLPGRVAVAVRVPLCIMAKALLHHISQFRPLPRVEGGLVPG
jgi:hypothetical protein